MSDLGVRPKPRGGIILIKMGGHALMRSDASGLSGPESLSRFACRSFFW